jgi:hypothetical protein
MLDDQDGACLICGTTDFVGKGPVVDHDHETGEVRGILCTHCNSGLGFFKDNPVVMKRAIDYIARRLDKSANTP